MYGCDLVKSVLLPNYAVNNTVRCVLLRFTLFRPASNKVQTKPTLLIQVYLFQAGILSYIRAFL